MLLSFLVAGMQTRWLALEQSYWTRMNEWSECQSNKIEGVWVPWNCGATILAFNRLYLQREMNLDALSLC